MIKRTEENSDMAGSRAAMFRAARRACELAEMHGHPVAISRGGKVVGARPQEVLAELDAREHALP